MTPPAPSDLPDARVLLLPGWQGAGPTHWQSHWEQRHGDTRVDQDDWLWPKRGDWMSRLEDVLLARDQPAVLVAHGLGCLLVAAWAAHSAHTSRVKAALLVAPPDIEHDNVPPQLAAWRPTARSRLPFAAMVVICDDDPIHVPAHAAKMAADWGCRLTPLGPRGHLSADSGAGDWPEGRALLTALMQTPS